MKIKCAAANFKYVQGKNLHCIFTSSLDIGKVQIDKYKKAQQQ